jgi:hypothetical protein
MAAVRIPIKTRLKAWHLSRVPFPSVPFVQYFNEDPLRNGSVFVPELRQDQINQLRTEILCNGWPDAVKRWSWVWAHKHVGGSLGMGKSALLGYITDQINRDFGSSFFHRAAPWLAVYVKVPEKVRSTAQVLAVALASIYNNEHGVSVERRLVGRLRHKVVALNGHLYPATLSTESETQFADDGWLVGQGVDLTALNKLVAELLKRDGVRAAIADAFSRCALQEALAVYKDDADSPSFRPAQASVAFSILLNDMAKIARAADLLHITMILDDFYFLVKNTKPADRQSLAEEWRDIAVMGDYKAARGNVFNWVTVMHINTAGTFNQAWENASMHNLAPLSVQIGNVITRPGVDLRALPGQLGPRLLEAYIRYSRVGRAPTPVYPFTEEALTYITEVARKKGQEQVGKCDPRNLVEVAQNVFVRALFDATNHPTIDLAFTKHVLEGIPLPDPTATTSIDAMEAADEAAVAPSERRAPLNLACACDCHLEDGTSANDLVPVMAGAADDNSPDAIVGYVCLACNAPATPAAK